MNFGPFTIPIQVGYHLLNDFCFICLFDFNFYFFFQNSGYVEPLEKGIEIVVPEDDHGLYAIDILDPSFVSFS